MTLTLDQLPNEIIFQILLCIPPTSVPALQQVSKQFNDLSQPLLWRYHCSTLFRYWSPEHAIDEKFNGPVAKVDWKKVFAQRRQIDRSISREIDSILGGQVGRIEKTSRIVEYGYDAKDTLLRHLSVADDADDVLARRFYSGVVLGSLHRTMAIREWVKLNDGQATSLERALAAFDMFVLERRKGDFNEVSSLLDQLAERFRLQCPNFADQSPRGRTVALAAYLRKENLTGVQGDSHYHDLQNNFIGVALQDPDHPSLPLISVAIFCCIAHRIGLDAYPCGFPFHVLATVKPPSGLDLDGNNVPSGVVPSLMYMDPFRSSEETELPDLRAQLQSLGIPVQNHQEFLDASPIDEIVRRSAKNIITSMSTVPRNRGPGSRSSTSFLDPDGALYAAFWALLLLQNGDHHANSIQRARFLDFIVERLETQSPMDVGLIEAYLLPLLENPSQHGGLLDTIRVIRRGDLMPKHPKGRTTPETREIKYKIGQVFHHKRYHYNAVITGWDIKCEADSDWMAHMRIHELSRGQHQSFYHVLVDDSSVRYVAEDNIEIIHEAGPELMALAGQHFKRWDKVSRTFVSNIKDEYPED